MFIANTLLVLEYVMFYTFTLVTVSDNVKFIAITLPVPDHVMLYSNRSSVITVNDQS